MISKLTSVATILLVRGLTAGDQSCTALSFKFGSDTLPCRRLPGVAYRGGIQHALHHDALVRTIISPIPEYDHVHLLKMNRFINRNVCSCQYGVGKQCLYLFLTSTQQPSSISCCLRFLIQKNSGQLSKPQVVFPGDIARVVQSVTDKPCCFILLTIDTRLELWLR